MRSSLITGTVFCLFFITTSLSLAASPSSANVAQQIDQALTEEIFTDSNIKLAPRTNDATFLRRVTLDIVGDIPTPEAITSFLLDPSADKRQRLIQSLLAAPHYGQNWARYWRDVVFFHTQEARPRIAINAMVTDLTQQLNDNVGWDKIATQFITATGDVREHGHTAIIMAQEARTEETAAEVSRIFLGIQIQCAQCHDHPYDRWKREQFHELAAFFPRIGVRNVRSTTKRSLEIYSENSFRGKQRKSNNNRRPQAEHRMPHHLNPDLPGSIMQPKFFLTSATFPLATRDAERREQLAEWLTENKWFAIAIVNRLWCELVGESFYERVDDIGPDREPIAPKALDLLAKNFEASGYDLQWLLATICQTEAYQRESRPRRKPDGIPFVANVPQRMRSDQLFNAFYTATDAEEKISNDRGRKKSSDREQFDTLFGYDPSQLRAEISASIPQSLALMNAPQIDRYLKPRRDNLLGRLLVKIPANESLIVELYLRCLSREPNDDELTRAMNYIKEVPKRREAFEDLLWALVNSAEFQYRR